MGGSKIDQNRVEELDNQTRQEEIRQVCVGGNTVKPHTLSIQGFTDASILNVSITSPER